MNSAADCLRTLIAFPREGRERAQLCLLISVSVVLMLAYTALAGVRMNADSPTYFSAGQVLLSGFLDLYRTPLYPLYLSSCSHLAGETHVLALVGAGQLILFAISVYFFYRTLNLLTDRRQIVFYVTLVYACHPNLICWVRAVITEPFSIPLMVFLLYCLVNLCKNPGWKMCLWLHVWLAMMLLLRPSFLYLVPLDLIGWGIALRVTRSRLCGFGMVLAILTASGVFGYCKVFQRQHGFFSPSAISLVNQWYILRESGILDDGTLRRYTKLPEAFSANPYAGAAAVIADGGPVGLQRIVGDAIGDNRLRYLHAGVERFYRARSFERPPVDLMKKTVPATFFLAISPLVDFLSCNLYLLILISAAGILMLWFRTRRAPWLELILWLLVAGHVFSSVAGAQGAWGRLIVPAYPPLLLLLAVFLSRIKYSVDWSRAIAFGRRPGHDKG